MVHVLTVALCTDLCGALAGCAAVCRRWRDATAGALALLPVCVAGEGGNLPRLSGVPDRRASTCCPPDEASGLGAQRLGARRLGDWRLGAGAAAARWLLWLLPHCGELRHIDLRHVAGARVPPLPMKLQPPDEAAGVPHEAPMLLSGAAVTPRLAALRGLQVLRLPAGCRRCVASGRPAALALARLARHSPGLRVLEAHVEARANNSQL